jgi:hypothetical protein
VESHLQEELDAALERLAETRSRAAEAVASLERRKATATSTDHMVSATVDSRGVLVGLKFNTTKYRTMAPAQLAAAITEVVGEANAEMSTTVDEILAPLRDIGNTRRHRIPLPPDLADLFERMGVRVGGFAGRSDETGNEE